MQIDSSAASVGRQTPRTARPGSARPGTPGYSRGESRQQGAGRGGRPPWKGSDVTPQDTWRLNYLDNDDEIEKVNKLWVSSIGNSCLDCFIWFDLISFFSSAYLQVRSQRATEIVWRVTGKQWHEMSNWQYMFTYISNLFIHLLLLLSFSGLFPDEPILFCSVL